jgi:hypothetical protein
MGTCMTSPLAKLSNSQHSTITGAASHRVRSRVPSPWPHRLGGFQFNIFPTTRMFAQCSVTLLHLCQHLSYLARRKYYLLRRLFRSARLARPEIRPFLAVGTLGFVCCLQLTAMWINNMVPACTFSDTAVVGQGTLEMHNNCRNKV